MHLRVIVVAGLALWAPISRAGTPSPEETVELLIHANHGLGELAGKELLETWAQVQHDPKPYLPALHGRVTWERIEAPTDEQQRRGIRGAIGILLLIGREEDRALLVTRLKQVQSKRDELSASVKAQGRVFASLSESEKQGFREQGRHMSWLIRVEAAILRGFGEVRDPRLRDMLLQRLDQDSDMLERYVSYFEDTCRQDPVVRARLKKVLEAHPSEDPLFEQRLRHF